ncbi:MAG: CDP-glycerol glycerophosphotransferase family protein [Lactobacillus sp.]
MVGCIYLITKCGYWFFDVIVPVDRHFVLFCSFSGRQVSDSPKAIYDELMQDRHFSHYRMVWVVTDSKLAKDVESVKMGSFKYYWFLFRARYWVANTSIERLVALNRKKHVYINTWHGIPLKKLALDEPHLSYLVKKWYQTVQFDLLTCCSAYDQAIFERIFPNTKNIEAINLPRNYPLVQRANEQAAF